MHNHLSSSQVWSARFGFMSLGSLTVLRLLCVYWIYLLIYLFIAKIVHKVHSGRKFS